MSDPFDEPAYEPEKGPSRFEQFRASLTSPSKVANEPLDESPPTTDHKRTWSGEPVDGGSALPQDDGASLFQRFRKSLNGDGDANSPLRVAPEDEYRGDDASTETSTSTDEEETTPEKPPAGNTESGGAAAEPVESPSSSGWSFFKTKEQKELIAVGEAEEKERKTIKEEQKSERKPIEKEFKAFEEKCKELLKVNAKALHAIESEEKKLREEVAKEGKKEHDEMEKTFKKELKKLK